MNSIPLRDFVRQTLVEITTGVVEANQELSAKLDSPNDPQYLIWTKETDKNQRAIEFDIAVVASKDSATKTGFGVALVNIGGGASAQKEVGSEITHRIKFEVITNGLPFGNQTIKKEGKT